MARQNIYIVAATLKDKDILRFVVCSRMAESRDIQFAWEEIRGQAEELLMGNDTYGDILVHECKANSSRKYNAILEDCPSNGVKINGIKNGQA
jgi:methionyl-tRNA synthetase